jgi:AcrR family transcriptional regulator
MTTVINTKIQIRARKKLATRSRIIEVAIRLMGERGLEAPTVEEIAAAAEVGKGTIYNYFESKEEIVVAFMVDLERRLQLRVPQFVSTSLPLEQVLAAYIRYHLRLKEPYRDFVRVFMAQLALRGGQLGAQIAEITEAAEPPLLDFLERLQASGLLRRDLDLQRFARAFEALHLGIVMLWLNDSPPYANTYRILDDQMRFLAHGAAAAQKHTP